MDKEFKKDLENRIKCANEELEIHNKELSFYEKIEESSFGDSVSRIFGSYEDGFVLEGNNYSVVNDFNFSKGSRYDVLSDSTASLIGKINFFNNNLFEDFKVQYKLVQSKKDEEMQMNILYILHIDNGDYSGSPGFAIGPHFTFPKKVEEIENFYLSKGMNENLISRVMENIKNIRSAL